MENVLSSKSSSYMRPVAPCVLQMGPLVLILHSHWLLYFPSNILIGSLLLSDILIGPLSNCVFDWFFIFGKCTIIACIVVCMQMDSAKQKPLQPGVYKVHRVPFTQCAENKLRFLTAKMRALQYQRFNRKGELADKFGL